jgi:hypothetical protein
MRLEYLSLSAVFTLAPLVVPRIVRIDRAFFEGPQQRAAAVQAAEPQESPHTHETRGDFLLKRWQKLKA